MTPPSILIAADGGPSTGLGHLARSSALALALRDLGVPVSCTALGARSDTSIGGVGWSPGDIDDLVDAPAQPAIVLDSYDARRDDVDAVAGFHDHGAAPRRAAVVISVGTKSPGPEHWCCGLTYVCLRSPFSGASRASVRDGAHRVLITTGGGDPDEAAIGLVGAARNALPGAELRLVIGPQAAGRVPDGIVPVSAPESLYDEMRAADLIICGAGQSAFEAVSLGVPTAVVPLVDNQMGNAQRLAEAQAARVLWPGDDPRPHLRELATDPEVRAGLAQRGRLTIDGRGARRVAAKILAALIGAAA